MAGKNLIQKHFNRIAGVYRSIRETDPEPVFEIKKWLAGHRLRGMDLGCGTGRYSELVLSSLRPKSYICADLTPQMLSKARRFLKRLNHYSTVSYLVALARALPLSKHSLDFMTTFNAVHHFALPEFLKEAARVLKPGGLLFIYTRSPAQNRRTIWGRSFPKFCQKEKRLVNERKFSSLIKQVPGLNLIAVKRFIYYRKSSLVELKFFASRHHYSTFTFYKPREFKAALKGFEKNLQKRYPDSRKITYSAENTLLVIGRSG